MRIGISGYMGAGKTTCTRKISANDALVIDGDIEAKKMMRSDPDILSALHQAFGESSVNQAGPRFDQLASQAFASLDSLKTLNSIVHPPLIEHLRAIIHTNSRPNVILDAALIPLWNIESWFDLCIWVEVPFETRLQRLRLNRVDLSEGELRHRMDLQHKLLPLPEGPLWVKTGDEECGELIRKNILEHHPDSQNAGSGDRS